MNAKFLMKNSCYFSNKFTQKQVKLQTHQAFANIRDYLADANSNLLLTVTAKSDGGHIFIH